MYYSSSILNSNWNDKSHPKGEEGFGVGLTKHVGLLKRAILILHFTFYISHYSQAQLIPNLGGQRSGISSFTFLKNDVSARAIGLGGAITTMKGDAYASQWNPAALTETNGHSAAIATRIYAAGINHSFAAANIRLRETDYISVNVNNLSAGSMPIRTEFQPNGTGQTFDYSNIAIGITYAKALTYRFSVGATIKYVAEQIDMYRSNSAAVDVGFIYKTDFKNLRFGVFLQNFGPNSLSKGDYVPVNFANRQFTADAFPVPTVFKFGASITAYEKNNHRITPSIELNHPNDNATNFRIGVEYDYLDMFYARVGYAVNLSGYTLPTFGIGVNRNIKDQLFSLNYAFVAMNALGINHNISLSIIINQPKREEPTQ